MKKLCIVVLMSLFAVVSTANAAKKATNIKLAVVNSYALMQKLSPKVETSLDKEFANRKDKLLGMQTKLKKSEEKLQRDAAVMSNVERNKMQRELKATQRDFQRLRSEYNDDLKFRKNEELQKIFAKINNVIADIEKDSKYDVILRKEAAIFVDNKFDITERVLKRYQKEHGKG